MTLYFDSSGDFQSRFYFAGLGEGFTDDLSYMVQHDQFHPPFFNVVRIYEMLPKGVGKGEQASYNLIGEYRQGQPVLSLDECVLFAILESNIPEGIKQLLGSKRDGPQRSWPPYGVWKV